MLDFFTVRLSEILREDAPLCHITVRDSGSSNTVTYYRFEYIGGGYVPQSDCWEDGMCWEPIYGYTVADSNTGEFERVTDKDTYRMLDCILDYTDTL